MSKWVMIFVLLVLIVLFGVTGCATQHSIPAQGHVRYIDIDPTVDYVQLMVIQPREVAGKAKLVTSPQAICVALSHADFERADVVQAECADIQCRQMVLIYQCTSLYGY